MLTHGDLVVDAGRREVRVGDEEIQLAPKEFDLLWELLDHRGLVLTRDQLLERVWGYTFAGDTRTVDVHVRQLRRKLGDASPIVTVWGVGYKVSPAREPATSGAVAPGGAGVFRSLRFQLPALFLAGVIVLRGLVAAAIAFQLFQSYTLGRARARPAARGARAHARSTPTQASGLERPRSRRRSSRPATGDRIFYVRVDPGSTSSPARRSAAAPAARSARSTSRPSPRAGRVAVRASSRRGSEQDVARRRAAARARPGRRAGVLGALVVAKPKDQLATRVVPLLERLALALLGGLVVVAEPRAPTSRGGSRGRCSSSRAPPTRSRGGNYEVEVPSVRGGDEVGHLADRFREMARRLGEAEQLERNFLMSVSHELRTPLTAIRGHVAALQRGPRRGRGARARLARDRRRRDGAPRRGSSATCSTSPSSTRAASRCCRRRSTWSSSSSAPTRRSTRRRGGAGSTTAATTRAAGADDRRRPRAPDHHEPPVERVPLDARRRPHRARARRRRTAPSPSPSRTPGPGIRPRSASGSSGRSGRATAAEPASASRSRTSSRRRSAAASSSTPRSAAGSTFELVLPAN